MSDLTLNLAGALEFVGIVLSIALAILWFTIRSITPDDSSCESRTKSPSGDAENAIMAAAERSWDSGAKT